MSGPTSMAYATRVTSMTRLSAHFTRVTLACPDLARFGGGGFDQRIKLFLPRADGGYPELGLFAEPRPSVNEWYGRWRALDDAERNPIRTYTVREARPELSEIDVDFVLHGVEGPASAWAMNARVGDELIVIGPYAGGGATGGGGAGAARGARAGGVEWSPGLARRVMLAGDETAAPAISSILESLGEEFSGTALIEVPDAGDRFAIAAPGTIEVEWLARGDRPHGEALAEALRSRVPAGPAGVHCIDLEEPTDEFPVWEVPQQPATGSQYFWLAGEGSTITDLRRFLVRDRGIHRRSVAFMGYWRQGRAEGA